MKVDIDPFEANFAKLVFLTVNMVGVQTGVANKTIVKEAITQPLAKSDNLAEKEKLNGESKIMPINMANMSQKVKVEFDSEYEMNVFKNKQNSIYPQAREDLLDFLIRPKSKRVMFHSVLDIV